MTNRTHSLPSKPFRLAALWGWRARADQGHLRVAAAAAGAEAERTLTGVELRRLVLAMHSTDPFPISLFTLYLLTGARPGELPPLRRLPDARGREL
jgi:hypothetical protein